MNISATTRALLASRAFMVASAIIVFFLTLAALNRPRYGEDFGTVPATGNPGETQRRTSLQLVRRSPDTLPRMAAAHPSNTASSPNRTPAAKPVDNASQDAAVQEAVPVWLTTRTAADQVSRVVFLQNTSGEPLNVSVMAMDPASGHQSTVQVVVPAGGRKNLTKLGLVVEYGNQVTVQSPSYRDLVTQVD